MHRDFQKEITESAEVGRDAMNLFAEDEDGLRDGLRGLLVQEPALCDFCWREVIFEANQRPALSALFLKPGREPFDVKLRDEAFGAEGRLGDLVV